MSEQFNDDETVDESMNEAELSSQNEEIVPAESQSENSTENSSESSEKPQRKKLNPVLRFFRNIFIVILVLLLAVIGIFAYSSFDSKSSLSSIPRNYSLYVRTSSAFDALNPLFDLQAADVILSSPEFVSFRKMFMDFRSSQLRENKIVQFAASRPVDFALYGNGTQIGKDAHFVAVINLGFLSFASRAAQALYPKIGPKISALQIENLSFETSDSASYFAYQMPDFTVYFKAFKNLVIFSDSYEHLLTASLVENDISYTKEQRALFKGGKKGELRIVADASSLLHFATEGNEILSSMSKLITSDSLSVISFKISDSDVAVNCRIPANSSEEDAASLAPILSKKSTTPSLLSRLSDSTQYYTILNAGNLEELKNAFLPFVPDVKNPDEFWENCDGWSKTILSMDLNEFLFSWTGKEFALLGLEGQNDPVFVIQVKDEKQRQKVFNKLTSSILIKDDTSLILGGVRLPRLQIPSFLSWVLSIIGVNMPEPYFMAMDGNIYFSESAECLSLLYNAAHSGSPLVKNKDYIAASQGLKNDSSLSLFYNLDRSIPFFLRSQESFSRVLQLYTMGRFDIRFEKNLLELSLHACARKTGNSRAVPGFPIQLSGKSDAANLQVDSGKSPKHVYWVENSNTIKSLDVQSMEIASKQETDSISIVVASKQKNEGVLWSVSSHGMVSLLSSSLENLAGFPVVLGENLAARPCAVQENLVAVSENGNVFIIKPDSSFVTVEIPELSAKSEPVALEDSNAFAIYSKGFLGKIYYFEGEKCLNLENPFEVPGIALGSPAIMKSGGKNYIGFITQAGEMNVWRADSKDGSQADGFPLRLGDVFLSNVVASEKYFYALSSDAILYRISKDGSILSLQVPQSSAKEGYISLRSPDGNGKQSLFVCADSNVIYGFNENLELLPEFPLTGWGKPVFIDVNGDKKNECVALTVDRKLVAWKTN